MTTAANGTVTPEQTGWRFFFPVIVIYLILFTALFYETFVSMVSIWLRSETFTHAFLILPISIWLVWEKREALKYEHPKPSLLGMVALTCSGFLWLFGYLVDALVVQQFAWVLAFIAGVWAVLGNRVAWSIAFPLAFLIFLVPFGEGLVPSLMEFTADFTIALIKLTGIPVYREGLYFTLPTGKWSVVEACSGIRYLIASLTLGCLYSYLTYSSLKKRLIFIIISMIVPVIANGLRAYIIVMLGHMSDMSIATGVDHLVYGWVFFGVIIFLLIMVGSRFRDADVDEKINSVGVSTLPKVGSGLRQAIQGSVISIILIGVWPVLAYEVENTEVMAVESAIAPITGLSSWANSEVKHWDWEPVSVGARKLDQYFTRNNANVGMHLQYYFTQEKDAELINWRNKLLDSGIASWRIVGQKTVQVKVASDLVGVDQTILQGPREKLIVWSWYRVGDYYTSSKYLAKLLEGWAKVTFSRQDAGKIIVAISLSNDETQEERSAVLQNFISEVIPEIERVVDKTAGVR